MIERIALVFFTHEGNIELGRLYSLENVQMCIVQYRGFTFRCKVWQLSFFLGGRGEHQVILSEIQT
jgi:hypothetical protein